MEKKSDLVSHMKKVAKSVESWPAWKKNALGSPKPKNNKGESK